MRPTPLILASILLLAGGCRTTDALINADPLTGGYAPPKAAEAIPPSRLPAPSMSSRDGVRQVAYESQTGEGPNLAPAPLQIPQAGGLPQSDYSLLDLEDIAMRNSPVIAMASARVRAAQGNWLQVGLPPNLTVGYSGQQLGSHGLAEQQGGYLGQKFITGGKLRLNREAAAWQVQQAERDMEAFRLRVLTDVRIGYYNVLIAQRRRDLTEELVRISLQGVDAAQALFRGEEVSVADPLRATVEAETARILLQNAINQHLESWRRLIAVLGVPDMPLQHIEGELRADDLSVTWQEELERLLAESPELSAAVANVEAARWLVRRAYAQVVPDIDVQAILQDDRSTGSSNGILQVTMPLPLWNRNQGGIAQARAQATAANRAVDRLTLDLQARLATAFQSYESARNQVEQYSRKGGIIDNSKRTLDLIRAGYQAEEFGVLDLLTAQRTYFRTNLAYLDSLRGLSASVMEIRGLLLSGSLTK